MRVTVTTVWALVGWCSAVQAARYIAYYTSWSTYARNFQVSSIPFAQLTHVFYAFANVNSAGEMVVGDSYADTDKAFPGDSWDTSQQAYRGNFWQLLHNYKPRYPNVTMVISVGGWSWSGQFSTVAATPASRSIFVQSMLAFLAQYPFDGVDIDWEYPVAGGLATNAHSPHDSQNYLLLLQAMRQALDNLPGPRKFLSVAAPAGLTTSPNMPIEGLGAVVDSVNLMTYDYRGSWSTFTGHHSPLYGPAPGQVASQDPDAALGDTVLAVNYYLSRGLPAGKLCVGFAIYGHGWAGVSSNLSGLYQTFQSVPRGTWDDWSSGNTGVFDYKDVKARVSSGQLTRYWDSNVKAAWAYSSTSQLMISYDDPQSVQAKINYVLQTGLAGLMCWELSGDDGAELSTVVYTHYLQVAPSVSVTGPPSRSLSGTGAVQPADPSGTVSGSFPAPPDLTGVGEASVGTGHLAVPLSTSSFLLGILVGAVVTALVTGLVYFGFKRHQATSNSAQSLAGKHTVGMGSANSVASTGSSSSGRAPLMSYLPWSLSSLASNPTTDQPAQADASKRGRAADSKAVSTPNAKSGRKANAAGTGVKQPASLAKSAL